MAKVANDRHARRPVSNDDIMVPYAFVRVGSFLVTLGTGSHEAVNGGDEKAVEDNQSEAIQNHIFKVIPSVAWIRIFDDFETVVVVGEGIGIVSKMVVIVRDMGQVDVTDDACKR